MPCDCASILLLFVISQAFNYLFHPNAKAKANIRTTTIASDATYVAALPVVVTDAVAAVYALGHLIWYFV